MALQEINSMESSIKYIHGLVVLCFVVVTLSATGDFMSLNHPSYSGLTFASAINWKDKSEFIVYQTTTKSELCAFLCELHKKVVHYPTSCHKLINTALFVKVSSWLISCCKLCILPAVYHLMANILDFTDTALLHNFISTIMNLLNLLHPE